jgi:hypothetical protein
VIEVLTRLSEIGCHPADVGQAMAAEDPGWVCCIWGWTDVQGCDRNLDQAARVSSRKADSSLDPKEAAATR